MPPRELELTSVVAALVTFVGYEVFNLLLFLAPLDRIEDRLDVLMICACVSDERIKTAGKGCIPAAMGDKYALYMTKLAPKATLDTTSKKTAKPRSSGDFTNQKRQVERLPTMEKNAKRRFLCSPKSARALHEMNTMHCIKTEKLTQ